jgi:hypothetical protein
MRNLEKFILQNLSMIMCTKISQKDVAKAIESLGEFELCPTSLTIDHDEKIFYKQFEIDYEVEGKRHAIKKANRLKVNLYFDLLRRSQELLQLTLDIDCQKKSIEEILNNKTVLQDIEAIKREYCYFKLDYDHVTKTLIGYSQHEKKIEKAKIYSGFFAIMTHKLDFDAMEIFHIYRLRDEQEKYFQQMKSQMCANRQRNSSEDGKTGRLFILFVSLIMSSYLRHIWNSTELKGLFPCSLDILEEMSSIRWIQHPSREKMISPFVGAQLDICEAFGFEVPKGCAPAYPTRQKPKRKRGRPRKRPL